MSIDAVIERVKDFSIIDKPGSHCLRLELAPRVQPDGTDSIAGRSALHLLGERTFEPQVGMTIWGGADTVMIVDGPEYARKGTSLREKRNCPRCFARMGWADISNTETGEQRSVWRCQECGTESAL